MSWQQPQQPQQPPYPQQTPQGQLPPGQFPSNQFPPNQLPPGQFPPGQYPYPPARPSQALAIVALVTGILSLLLSALLGPFAVLFGIAGIVTGAVALSKRQPGRGMALAGLITGAVGILVAVVVTIAAFVLYGGLFLVGALNAADSWDEGYYGDFGDEYGGGYSAGDYAFGEQVALDEYAVSVDDVQVRGDVVFADLTVQFNGSGTGDSYEDLYGYLYDVDGYEYAATDCHETLTPDAADLPDLASGETATFQMCFDGVTDTDGVWVTVVDDEGYGTSANWTDDLTLEGSSNTGV